MKLLDDRLHRAAIGEIKRLMIFMPPQHGKSTFTSQYFAAWCVMMLGKKVMLTSYQASYAEKWGMRARDVVAEWGNFFGVRLGPLQAMNWWDTRLTRRNDPRARGWQGQMMTDGMGGSLTGKGFDIGIIDDPLKNAEEARSATIREHHWEWYQTTFRTRRTGPHASIVLMMTRWNHDDIAGRLLEAMQKGEGDEWEVLSLPALAERDECYEIRGCAPFVRKEGDALWPQRFTKADLEQTRKQDLTTWTALYQQRPNPESGLLIHREWFKRYTTVAGPPKCERIIQVIDTAFKTGVANDYSVIATWGYTPNAIYVLDCWRSRVEYPDLKRAIADQAAKWQPQAIYVEDTAAGQSVIQEMQRESLLPIIPWAPRGSKEARIAAVSPLIEAGKVYIPDDQPWVAEWLDEHVAFPRGAHDDMVDTTAMALEQIRPDTFTQGPKIF